MKCGRTVACAWGILLAGCGSSSAGSAPDDAGPEASAADGGPQTNVRGQRYCEILLATLNGTSVHVDVYNTFGLNDCPDAAWSQVDPKAVAQAEGATEAILNGPRYWMIDGFVEGTFLDPTPKTLGGIAMRRAGAIDLPASQAGSVQMQYVLHTIQRNTTVVFSAGKSVYELVDSQGKVYDMQSYSIQKTAQTEADLASLGAKLTLPSGWIFRTRVLTSDLTVTAVGGTAYVTQDDFENTYQQSQQ